MPSSWANFGTPYEEKVVDWSAIERDRLQHNTRVQRERELRGVKNVSQPCYDPGFGPSRESFLSYIKNCCARGCDNCRYWRRDTLLFPSKKKLVDKTQVVRCSNSRQRRAENRRIVSAQTEVLGQFVRDAGVQVQNIRSVRVSVGRYFPVVEKLYTQIQRVKSISHGVSAQYCTPVIRPIKSVVFSERLIHCFVKSQELFPVQAQYVQPLAVPGLRTFHSVQNDKPTYVESSLSVVIDNLPIGVHGESFVTNLCRTFWISVLFASARVFKKKKRKEKMICYPDQDDSYIEPPSDPVLWHKIFGSRRPTVRMKN